MNERKKVFWALIKNVWFECLLGKATENCTEKECFNWHLGVNFIKADKLISGQRKNYAFSVIVEVYSDLQR